MSSSASSSSISAVIILWILDLTILHIAWDTMTERACIKMYLTSTEDKTSNLFFFLNLQVIKHGSDQRFAPVLSCNFILLFSIRISSSQNFRVLQFSQLRLTYTEMCGYICHVLFTPHMTPVLISNRLLWSKKNTHFISMAALNHSWSLLHFFSSSKVKIDFHCSLIDRNSA